MHTQESPTSGQAYIYVLYGHDEFSLAEQVAALREKMLQYAAGEYNIASLDGGEVPIAEIIAQAEAVPFLADRRMVIVRGLLGAKASAPARSRRGRGRDVPRTDAPLSRLLEWLPSAPQTTSLVFIDDDVAEPVLAELRLLERVVIRRFDPPRGERLVRWLLSRAQRHGATLSVEAAQILAQSTDDLRRLDSELAKLATHGGGGLIQAEAVGFLVAGAETTIFALLDAVAERKTGAAVHALHALLEQGQRPEAILAQLASMVRRLLIVKELSRQGTISAGDAAKHGLNPNALPKLQRQAKMLHSPDLERALDRLLEADRASKTGQMESEIAVELAVAELCAGGSPTARPPAITA